MSATANEFLESLVGKAKAALGDDDKAAPKKQERIKSVAERLLSVGNEIAKIETQPDAAVVLRLKGMANELSAAIDSFPAPKRMAKTVQMTIAEFQKHFVDEIDAFKKDADTERLTALEANLESVVNQLSAGPVDTIKISVTNDPAQQQTTETEQKPAASAQPGPMGAFAKSVEELTKVIEKLKQAPPFGGKPAKPFGGKPGDDEDEETKTKKAKEKEADEEEAKRRKAADEPEETDEDKKNRRAKDKEDADKKNTNKGDDTAWPLDLNKGRDLNDSERWGLNKRSVTGDDRSFGADPKICRE